MAIEIVIVDDQELMRLSFRLVLDSQPDLRVTGEAANGLEAVVAARRLRPDVMLMDVRMPELDGVHATREIMALDPDARIILVTTFDVGDYLQEGMQAGARGFLLKDASPERLLSAVRAVAAGDTVLPQTASARPPARA